MSETFAEHCRKVFNNLPAYEHQLCADVVDGLVKTKKWKWQGGNKQTFALLENIKDGSQIKIYRKENMPDLIIVRFSAPPKN